MRKLKDVFWGLCSKLSGILGVGIDKPAHFIVSFIYSFIVGFVLGGICGFIAGISLGIGKEYGDSKSPGNTWSWADLLSDALGAIFGAILIENINLC